MKKQISWRGAAALLGALALVGPALGAGEDEVVTVGEISYVSGGTGEESRQRLDALAAGFNLKIDFALQSGAYLSGVELGIADKSGRMLLETVTEGPILMVKLPAGSYEVAARIDGKRQQQKLTVVPGKLGKMHFRWPEEH